jgi:tetratricopeptide (TPR) repeat protein
MVEMADPSQHPIRRSILAALLLAASLAFWLLQGPRDSAVHPVDLPQEAEPWFALNKEGLTRFARGDYQAALTVFEHALAQQPQDAVLRKNVAQAHGALGWNAIRGGEFGDAQSHFDQAIAVFDAEASHHVGRALSFARRQRDDEALAALDVALRLKPDDPLANTIGGDLWYERNEFGRAMAAWETAVRTDPPDPALLARLDKLQSEYPRLSQLRQEQTRRFSILFEGREDPDRARQVLNFCEEAYQAIGHETGSYPDRPISVVLYTDQQFRDVTKTPTWTKALFDGKIHLPVGGSLDDEAVLRRVIAHEMTHAFVYQLTGGRAPTWLNEGLARWFEGPAPRTAAFAAPSIPLRDLHGSFLAYDEASAEQAYAESLSATAYLIERYGMVRMTRFLGTLAHASSFDQAFEDAYLISYADFADNWGGS